MGATMSLTLRSRSLSLSGLSLFAVALLSASALGCSADAADESEDSDVDVAVDASEEAITAGPSNFGYFVVTRRDMRKCVSPLCGGFYVKRVNVAKTRCADGSLQAECYVSSIELKNIGLSSREEADFRVAVESGMAIIKARAYKRSFHGWTLGTLKANEGWLGATGSTPDGTFFRIADNGIRCITTPCWSTSAFALNGNDEHTLIGATLDQTATPADQATLDRAVESIGTPDGLLVAGSLLLPKCLPTANCGPRVIASEIYVRVARREGRSCGARGTSFCNAGQFCSWKDQDICGAFDAAGLCAYRPQICPQIFKPVCACDGNTYSNSCAAAAAGASVSSLGACAAAN